MSRVPESEAQNLRNFLNQFFFAAMSLTTLIKWQGSGINWWLAATYPLAAISAWFGKRNNVMEDPRDKPKVLKAIWNLLIHDPRLKTWRKKT